MATVSVNLDDYPLHKEVNLKRKSCKSLTKFNNFNTEPQAKNQNIRIAKESFEKVVKSNTWG
jgi:hypothetical protein